MGHVIVTYANEDERLAIENLLTSGEREYSFSTRDPAAANVLNYVSYDFDELVVQLQKRLKSRDAWKDVYESSTGQMLIELHAFIANLVMFYVERRAEESYIETAKNLSSVVNLVKLLGYSPKRKSSATGVIRFSYSSAHMNKIYIHKFCALKSSGGIDYFVGEKKKSIEGAYTGVVIGGGYIPATVEGVGNYTDLMVIQGVKIDRTIISSGAEDQVYKIESINVDNDLLAVYVDNVEWSRVSSFAASFPENNHYVVTQELDNKLKVHFGDGIQGRIPPISSSILIRYVNTDGLDGNVYQSSQTFTIEDDLLDDDGAAVSGVTAVNPERLTDGDDAEDISEIKYEAPRVYKTGDRAVTRYDYIAILENLPGVAAANVWGESEESPPNYDMFNRVKLCVLMQNWEHPTSANQDSIIDSLYDLSMLTVKYEFVQATILYIISEFPSVTDIGSVDMAGVIVTQGGSIQQCELDISDALAAEFNLDNKTTRLGESKMYSNLARIVDDLELVSSHNMVLKIRKVLSGTPLDGYDDILDAIPILPENIEVYVLNVDGSEIKIAVDDGDGGFTDLTPEYTVTGTIDYSTGEISLSIDPVLDPESSVYVKYRQDSNGNIIVSDRQLCYLYSVDVLDIELEE